MPLIVKPTQVPEVPLEVDWLNPEFAKTNSVDRILNQTIFHGNRQVPFGDFFSLEGNADDEQIHWQGDFANVHWIGKRMKSGRMRIEGSVGRHLGSEMLGGEIELVGDASDWVGGEMKAGKILVHGNAGHLVGAAFRGSPIGMRGGSIFVHGNVGNEIGHSMRRGMIVIGGNGGDLTGFNMKAGTIIVLGQNGIRPGAGMKRGTIALLGGVEQELLPTFRPGSTIESVIFRLLKKQLEQSGLKSDFDKVANPLQIFHGDELEGGRGEILLPASQPATARS